MDFKSLYKQLEQKRYYVFSYEDILSFYPAERKDNLKRMLYRWKKKGWICTLKKGLYELTYPKDFIIPDMYIANRLYNPSYISLETALSHYSIIREISMAVTSISTKPTRKFKNKHGLFIYRTVRPDIFTGYYVEKQGNFDILIAEPERALIDFLYFKTYRSKKVNLKEERLDKEVISHLSKKKLYGYAKLYGIELKRVLHAYL
jgi:predicted transcriptional regulator of viral defense system